MTEEQEQYQIRPASDPDGAIPDPPAPEQKPEAGVNVVTAYFVVLTPEGHWQVLLDINEVAAKGIGVNRAATVTDLIPSLSAILEEVKSQQVAAAVIQQQISMAQQAQAQMQAAQIQADLAAGRDPFKRGAGGLIQPR